MTAPTSKKMDYWLVLIAVLAGFLNFFNIWQDKTANGYYTAAVTSMLQSFHNFFFVSFDPAGYVSVDKPPVAFWLQAMSSYVFGVHGWSVILPQALAGVGSVLLIYALVKPTFGLTSARIASLVFACTPIAVAVSRTNNVDSILVFLLLLATWMLFRGVRGQQWGWVVAAFGMVGIAFNVKMLQAYMVIPAFYLFYLYASKVAWKSKLKVLSGATAALIGLSLSWAVIVDAIPQDKRPYMGSSQTNSVLELAFGYNGISRLTGDRGNGGSGARPGEAPNQTRDGANPHGTTNGTRNGGGQIPPAQQQNRNAANNGDGGNRVGGGGAPAGVPGGNGQNGTPPGIPGGGSTDGPGRGGAFNTGQVGPLRLFQSSLSGQISWLLPLALFGALALLIGQRRRNKVTTAQLETLFWLAWLLPAVVFFSVAEFFHQYYLIMLAPPLAVLAGAGWTELWRLYREKASWIKWLFPAAIAVTTASQVHFIQPFYQRIGHGLAIGLGVGGGVATLVLILAAKKEKLAYLAVILGLVALLAAPLYWSSTPLLYGGNSTLPEAGPNLKGGAGMGGNPMGGSVNTKLLDYVTTHNTGEKYMFAVTRSTEASPYIIQTGKAVMAMGGFSGSDPIMTVERLKQMVANKEIKFFLLSAEGGSAGGVGSEGAQVITWIKAHSTEVPKSDYQGTTEGGQQQPQPQQGQGAPGGAPPAGGGGGSSALYVINEQSLN